MTACKTCSECTTVTSDQCNCLHTKCSISVCILYTYSTQRCPFIILMTHQTEHKSCGRDITAVHHIWLLHTALYSSLLEYDAVSMCAYFQTFWRLIMPSSQELKSPRRTVNGGDVAMHECSEQHFRTSQTTQKNNKVSHPRLLESSKACTLLKQASFTDLKLKIWNKIIQNPEAIMGYAWLRPLITYD